MGLKSSILFFRGDSMSQEMQQYFNRDTTTKIKGVALIIMFIHHFFTFPENWVDGISYPILEVLAPYFCAPTKICVSIFAFLTGYFYYYSKKKNYKYSLKKIADILLPYWLVFFIFALCAKVLVSYNYTPVTILKEMFALELPTMYHCWYVHFYCIVMLFLPVYAKLLQYFEKHPFLSFCMILTPKVLAVLFAFVPNNYVKTILVPFFNEFPNVLAGYLFASFRWFDVFAKVSERIKCKVLKNTWGEMCVYFLLSIACIMSRWAVPTMEAKKMIPFPIPDNLLEIASAAIFVYSAAYMITYIKWHYLQIVLEQIGKYSMLMWFFHCIFFNNCKEIFQPILYLPKVPILVLIWGLLLSYLGAVLLNPVVDRVKSILATSND